MTYFIARCIWREDGSFEGSAALPDAWSLLDEEFTTQEEAETATRDDRLQQMQQRGGWMGVHRVGLKRLDYRIIEAEDFDLALERARAELAPRDALPSGAIDSAGQA